MPALIPAEISGGVDAVNATSLIAGTGVLVAVNAADGRIVWEAWIPTVVLGGATVTNNVVYAPNPAPVAQIIALKLGGGA